MTRNLTMEETRLILDRAGEYPDVLAGFCRIEDVKNSRSYELYHPVSWRSWRGKESNQTLARPDWPGREALLVLALAHPRQQPELDWWDGRGTDGNRQLRRILKEMKDWLSTRLEVKAEPLPYHPEKGGVFLKEAAAMAGMGTIGRNNLFITPEYGTRLRLLALVVAAELTSEKQQSDWDPCHECPAPCLRVCPVRAFQDGRYNRERCLAQMEADRQEVWDDSRGELSAKVRYCRRCELSCVAGQE